MIHPKRDDESKEFDIAIIIMEVKPPYTGKINMNIYIKMKKNQSLAKKKKKKEKVSGIPVILISCSVSLQILFVRFVYQTFLIMIFTIQMK